MIYVYVNFQAGRRGKVREDEQIERFPTRTVQFVGIIAATFVPLRSPFYFHRPSSFHRPANFLLFFNAFAEEFTSVVCDSGHRVPHPLIKDCATDLPSLSRIRLFFADPGHADDLDPWVEPNPTTLTP